MSEFKIKKPLVNNKNKTEIEAFAKGADSHTIDEALNKKAKPTKSFTVPLNEYELSLLRQVAENEDRSQRYMSRKLLVKALIDEIESKQ